MRTRGILALGLAALTAGVPSCLRVPTDLEDPGGMAAAPSTAAEVLERYVRAIGGEEKVRALGSRTVEARMTFLPEEGCEPGSETCISEPQSGTFVLQSTADGRLYRRTVLGALVEERGYDGKDGWQVLADGTVRVESAAEAAISREDARLHWYLDLAKASVEVTLLPARNTDSDGETRTLDGLRWEIRGAPVPPKSLWFDRATGLLREEVIEEGEGESLTRQTIIYESYQALDGARIPERIRLITEGGGLSREVEFFTTAADHEPIDPVLFQIPTPPPAEKKPDPRLTRLEQARAEAQTNPGNAAAAIAHSRAAWADARFEEAVKAAEATLAIDGSEPEGVWTLIRAAVLRGDYGAAERLIKRGRKLGIRESELGRQLAWIRSHQRDYRGMARAMDQAQQPNLAGRYRSFAGQPLQLTMGGDGCEAVIPMARVDPTPAVEIGAGETRVLALIDTGATDLILDEALASELGVAIQARTTLGAGGPEVGHGQLPTLEMGGVTLRNVPVDVFDAQAISSMAGNGPGGKVRAVIGLRTLERFQVTFDLAAKSLTVVDRDRRCKRQLARHRDGTSTPFWMHETHFLYTRAAMNGSEGLYLINTGMRGVPITATRPAYSYAGIGAPVIRPDEAAFVDVAELRVGEALTLREVKGAFGFFEQTETADGFRIDGMLGLAVLGRSAWTIDFDEQRLYFGPVASPSGTRTTD